MQDLLSAACGQVIRQQVLVPPFEGSYASAVEVNDLEMWLFSWPAEGFSGRSGNCIIETLSLGLHIARKHDANSPMHSVSLCGAIRAAASLAKGFCKVCQQRQQMLHA